MRLPKVTIRRLMALVFLAALGCWIGLRAWEVHRDKDYHVHIYVESVNGAGTMTITGAASPPFWPRYWRHLLGLPWKGQPVCGKGPGHIEELCSFARPDLWKFGPPSPIEEYEPPPEITAALNRIGEEWDRNHPEEARLRDEQLKELEADPPGLLNLPDNQPP